MFFKPKINELIFFPAHTLIWIESGRGVLEIDFEPYTDFKDKLIFLAPGQYLKLVFGDFELGQIEFPESAVLRSTDYRVLFKHLISLGYIEFPEKQALDAPQSILDFSTSRWYEQNPFKSSRQEYAVLFDLKDVIDQHFRENISVEQIVAMVGHQNRYTKSLVKERLGLTVKKLSQKKLLLESQKDIAFTEKPIQEVAYDLGFRDPAYFSRFFQSATQQTPLNFRSRFGYHANDRFLENLFTLIRQHHKQQHAPSFYADEMFMSLKTLSRKVKNRLGKTLGELIRDELVSSAKSLLQSLPVNETSFELGFEEPNHFSAFFKKYTAETPTTFLSKKYNS